MRQLFWIFPFLLALNQLRTYARFARITQANSSEFYIGAERLLLAKDRQQRSTNINPRYGRWREKGSNIVRYTIAKVYSSDEAAAIQQAITNIETQLGGCVKFQPFDSSPANMQATFGNNNRKQPTNNIFFTPFSPDGSDHGVCYTTPGRDVYQHAAQNVVISQKQPYGCSNNVRSIMHLLANLLGLRNEYQRPDRDLYIQVDMLAVDPQYLFSPYASSGPYDKYEKNQDVALFYAYDYCSITQVPANYLAKPNQLAFIVLQAYGAIPDSNAEQISAKDCQSLMALYQCSSEMTMCSMLPTCNPPSASPAQSAIISSRSSSFNAPQSYYPSSTTTAASSYGAIASYAAGGTAAGYGNRLQAYAAATTAAPYASNAYGAASYTTPAAAYGGANSYGAASNNGYTAAPNSYGGQMYTTAASGYGSVNSYGVANNYNNNGYTAAPAAYGAPQAASYSSSAYGSANSIGVTSNNAYPVAPGSYGAQTAPYPNAGPNTYGQNTYGGSNSGSYDHYGSDNNHGGTSYGNHHVYGHNEYDDGHSSHGGRYGKHKKYGRGHHKGKYHEDHGDGYGSGKHYEHGKSNGDGDHGHGGHKKHDSYGQKPYEGEGHHEEHNGYGHEKHDGYGGHEKIYGHNTYGDDHKEHGYDAYGKQKHHDGYGEKHNDYGKPGYHDEHSNDYDHHEHKPYGDQHDDHHESYGKSYDHGLHDGYDKYDEYGHEKKYGYGDNDHDDHDDGYGKQNNYEDHDLYDDDDGGDYDQNDKNEKSGHRRKIYGGKRRDDNKNELFANFSTPKNSIDSSLLVTLKPVVVSSKEPYLPDILNFFRTSTTTSQPVASFQAKSFIASASTINGDSCQPIDPSYIVNAASRPNICCSTFSVDEAVQAAGGAVYLFSGKYYYSVDAQRPANVLHGPNLISETFTGVVPPVRRAFTNSDFLTHIVGNDGVDRIFSDTQVVSAVDGAVALASVDNSYKISTDKKSIAFGTCVKSLSQVFGSASNAVFGGFNTVDVISPYISAQKEQLTMVFGSDQFGNKIVGTYRACDANIDDSCSLCFLPVDGPTSNKNRFTFSAGGC